MKRDLKTFDKIIAFAIAREADAEAFYRDLAGKVTQDDVRTLLEEFAEEERMHKDKLEKVHAGQIGVLSGHPAPRFNAPIDISPARPHPDMSLTEALAFAIKKEKAAYRLYLDMAVDAPTEDLMEVFLNLAREEANHKVRFEIEYDDLTAELSPD